MSRASTVAGSDHVQGEISIYDYERTVTETHIFPNREGAGSAKQ